jgi:hypothetical protein
MWRKQAAEWPETERSSTTPVLSRRKSHVSVKKQRLRRINQNVPKELYDRLAETALREDRTKSAVLVRALEAYFRASEKAVGELTRRDSIGEIEHENSR